jgi:Zn-dependent M28 family amino/carboxypeptidase
MKKIFQSAIVITGLLMMGACNDGPKKPASDSDVQKTGAVEVVVPNFNADSCYTYIEKQLSFGPRVPNTEAHKATAAWLTATLKRFTPNVVVQSARLKAFDGTTLDAQNIIASFNPDKRGRILLCAHWDSRPFADHDPDPANRQKPVPAANDGGSGVAVLLEIARQMQQHSPEMGVDIVLFDAEDYGEPQELQGTTEDSWALGSQYWSKNPHVPGYTARFGILLDMVGAANPAFTMEGSSMYYAPDIMRKVWNVADRLGFDAYFLNRKSGPITDDHVYVNENLRIPTIDIIDYDPDRPKGFFDQWHTVDDNISHISKETLKAVGQTVITVVYETK